MSLSGIRPTKQCATIYRNCHTIHIYIHANVCVGFRYSKSSLERTSLVAWVILKKKYIQNTLTKKK